MHEIFGGEALRTETRRRVNRILFELGWISPAHALPSSEGSPLDCFCKQSSSTVTSIEFFTLEETYPP